MPSDKLKNAYKSVSLAEINPDRPLHDDIYLFIDDKYIKFKKRGDVISVEKYNFFISKNVKKLFVQKEYYDEFVNWIEESKKSTIDEIIGDVGEENRNIVEKQEEIRGKVYETFSDEILSRSTVMILQGMVASFVEEVSKKKLPATVFARLLKQNANIANHSVNVASLSVFLAMTLGHGYHSVLENVYTGGLFHDYAKSKIPSNLLENPSSVGYSQAVQDHPEKGKAVLAKLEGITDEILTIIVQHHEDFNGGGYPHGLKGENIHKLTQIVSVANRFDNVLFENRDKPKKVAYGIGIKAIEYDRGKHFDPVIIPRILDALKLAYDEKKS